MKVIPSEKVPYQRVTSFNLKMFGPIVSGVKALGNTLLKTAGHVVLPKPLPSMKEDVPFAQNLFKQSALSRVFNVKVVFSGKVLPEVKQKARKNAAFVLEQTLLKALKQEHPMTLETFKVEAQKQLEGLDIAGPSQIKVQKYIQRLVAKVCLLQQRGMLRQLSQAVQAQVQAIRSEHPNGGPLKHLVWNNDHDDLERHLELDHAELLSQVKAMYGDEFVDDLVKQAFEPLPLETDVLASNMDPVAVSENELDVALDVSEEVPQEAILLEQHVIGEVKRWHVELFKQPDMKAGRIPDDLKTEKAQSLYAQLIDSNDFARANPAVLEHLIQHAVGRVQPEWQVFHGDYSKSIIPQFDGGYLKAQKEAKASPNSGLPFSLVKTTSGKVYELLNTLSPSASEALKTQHGLKWEGKVVLGQGTFGKVRLARDVQTQEIVAVKKFAARTAISDAEEELDLINLVQQRVASENPSARATLSSVLGHAHAHKSYVFMPLMNGGDGTKVLGQLKAMRGAGQHAEADARFLHIAKGYAEAVKNMHALGVVHRDIKTANFMHSWKKFDGLDQPVEQTTLIDFGFVGDQQKGNMPFDSGTAMYMPPEVQTKYGPENIETYDAKQMDSYSLGMVLLELLKGSGLYGKPSVSLNLIKQGGGQEIVSMTGSEKELINCKSWCFSGVPSNLLRNLAPNHIENVIAQLLAANPKDRMTATQAFEVFNRWSEQQSEASTSKSVTPRKKVQWVDKNGGSLTTDQAAERSIQAEASQQAPAAAKPKRSLYQSFFAQRKR